MKKKVEFADYISGYFIHYTVYINKISFNTRESYHQSMRIFVKYCNDVCKIKPSNLTFKKINRDLIEGFLNWLEQEGKSIGTVNSRLSAIKAVFKYINRETLEYADICSDILNIPKRKGNGRLIEYLTINAIRLLFSMYNVKNKRDLRVVTLLTLMYELGARVSEIINLNVGMVDLYKGTVILTGKGNKTRQVPINNKVVTLLRTYLKTYEITGNQKAFVFTNHSGRQLTRQGINYIVNEAIKNARKKHPKEFSISVSPHTFRHSKASHLLEEGMPITHIQRFLGHACVSTTQIYAKINHEILRSYIENHSRDIVPKSKYTSEHMSKLEQILQLHLQ